MDGGYLAIMMSNVHIPKLLVYIECIREKFLPVFEDLNGQADQVAERRYEELLAGPGDDGDPAAAAEEAEEESLHF